MATVHPPSPEVRTQRGQKVESVAKPTAKDKAALRSDRIHAMIVLGVVIAVFVLIILLAVYSPPPEGAEFKPWIVP